MRILCGYLVRINLLHHHLLAGGLWIGLHRLQRHAQLAGQLGMLGNGCGVLVDSVVDVVPNSSGLLAHYLGGCIGEFVYGFGHLARLFQNVRRI